MNLHLNESTLVFVSLELRGDIVAVAQIVRADNYSQQRSSNNNMSSDSRYLQGNQQQRQRSRNGFGADPLAIQRAIRDIHTSFSLLFGGGIHRRLLRTRQAEISKDWVLEVKVTAEDGDNNKKKNNDGSSGGHRTSFTHRRQNSDESDLSNIMLTTEQNWEVGIPGDTE